MSKRGKKKHAEEEGGEAWLLPYSDLMTLLLAVFIVLFAVSKVDQAKTEEMAKAFQSSMLSGGAGVFNNDGKKVVSMKSQGGEQNAPQSGNAGQTGTEQSTQSETTSQASSQATSETSSQASSETSSQMTQDQLEKNLGQYELQNMTALKAKLDALFEQEGLTNSISTSIDSRGLVVRLNNAILFDSGSADIKSENQDTLVKIANIINTLNNYIRIEGHTDNQPISNSVYPSNWELSTARASSVVRLFIDKCGISPEKIMAVGYGEYRPIADNTTVDGRAKNRRIDIILLSQKFNSLETEDSATQSSSQSTTTTP